MSEKIELTISDEQAEAIRQSVNARKDALDRQRARLRHGARKGHEAEELSDGNNVSTEEAVEFAVLFMATDDEN